jgi:hypothetical protein
MSSQKAAIVLVLAGSLGVGALAFYVKSTPNATHVPDDIRVVDTKKESKPPKSTNKPEATVTTASTTVRLPVFGDDISDMGLAKEETPVPGGGDAMKFVAQKIVEAARIDGARVLGVDVRDHVAIVNYNEAIGKGMGSMEEGGFIRALQIGFGQFTQIDKVTVEKEGQPLISGHVDLSEPLPVVRPGATSSEGSEPKSGEP